MDSYSHSRSGRVSRKINRKPASNIHHAIRMAAAAGTPLNTFATLTFSMSDLPPEEVSAAFARLRTFFNRWVRGVATPAFVWVIEACNGTVAVHWVAHVPPRMAAGFAKKLPGWFARVAGPLHGPGAIDIRTVRNPVGLSRYILKGMDEAFAKFYGVRFEDQGEVTNKRAGTSQSLGPTAKKRMREEGRYPAAKPFAIGMMRRAGAPRPSA